MDINTLRALATPIAFVAFIGIVFWAYSKGRKKDFDEAANLPFADEDIHEGAQRNESVEKDK